VDVVIVVLPSVRFGRWELDFLGVDAFAPSINSRSGGLPPHCADDVSDPHRKQPAEHLAGRYSRMRPTMNAYA
jgi:hypothetical protein